MTTKVFPGRYDQLSKISEFIEQVAISAGLNRKDTYSVQLAVDEACSNIITHAYGREDLGEIICTCSITDKGLMITLQDFGKAFNPDLIPEPSVHTDLENIKIGGLGLFFIRKLMDEVSFQFSPDSGNILTMTKYKEPGT